MRAELAARAAQKARAESPASALALPTSSALEEFDTTTVGRVRVHTATAGTIDEWDRSITGSLAIVQTCHQLKLVLPTTNAAGQPIFAEEQP